MHLDYLVHYALNYALGEGLRFCKFERSGVAEKPLINLLILLKKR